jgi:16S rRNA (cytidine1402-2'-O)-methyltransferase
MTSPDSAAATWLPSPGLYVVATPIGNLGDLSERAIVVLRSAALVAAEDTRTTRILLRRAQSPAKVVSLTEHNVEDRIPSLLETASRAVAALVSEAGTPLIADPAARLVAEAHRRGIRVSPIPGPSALTAALSVAGFEVRDVLFAGFAPRKPGELRELFARARGAARLLVLFERANRLPTLLEAAADALGDPEAAVCREMTKLHEEIARGRCSTLAGRFRTARGECTVVIALPEPETRPESEARRLLAAMRRAGARRSHAAAEVARLTGVPRDRVYRLWEDSNGAPEGNGS